MHLTVFPNELTEKDEDVGYRLMKVENRHSILYALGIAYQQVVAYQLSDSDLIVRAEDTEDGTPQYVRLRWGRKRFGNLRVDEFPDWHLCERTTFSDPGEAIQGFLFDPEPEGLCRVIPEPFNTFS